MPDRVLAAEGLTREERQVNTLRNRIAHRLANAALRLASRDYRLMVEGAWKYGLMAAARDEILASGDPSPSLPEWTGEGITEAIHAIADYEGWTDGEWTDKARRFRAALEGSSPSLPAEPSHEAINAVARLIPGQVVGTTHTDYVAAEQLLRAAYKIDGSRHG